MWFELWPGLEDYFLSTFPDTFLEIIDERSQKLLSQAISWIFFNRSLKAEEFNYKEKVD